MAIQKTLAMKVQQSARERFGNQLYKRYIDSASRRMDKHMELIKEIVFCTSEQDKIQLTNKLSKEGKVAAKSLEKISDEYKNKRFDSHCLFAQNVSNLLIKKMANDNEIKELYDIGYAHYLLKGEQP